MVGSMKPKVLIVDDEADLGHLLEFNLRKQGCETSCAKNGMQGLRLTRMELPDVILLLPDLDGLAVAEILYSKPSTRRIPVFMLSALSERFAQTRKRYAHYEMYFTKPVDMRVFGSSIRPAAKARQDAVLAQLKGGT